MCRSLCSFFLWHKTNKLLLVNSGKILWCALIHISLLLHRCFFVAYVLCFFFGLFFYFKIFLDPNITALL